MYETEYGMLVATADPVRTANLNELLEKSTIVCAAMYKEFLETSSQARPPKPEPKEEPKPDTLVSELSSLLESKSARLRSEPEPSDEPRERKGMFGVRLAYNNSYVSKMSLKKVYPDPDREWRFYEDEYYGKIGSGHGFEISAVTVIRFTDDIALNLSPGFIARTPYASDLTTINEFAVSIPVLFVYRLFGSSFSALAGFQADIPINTKDDLESGDDEEKLSDVRSNVDAGVVLGISVGFGRNMAFDVRGCIGLTDFADEKSRRLNQVSVGLSYLY